MIGRRACVLVVAVALVASGAATARAVAPPITDAPTFVHPGVLVGAAQLDVVRAKLAAGAEPWSSAYAALRRSRYASLTWQPRPRATVECGSHSVPDNGCHDEIGDALAAYTQALLWYLTRDARNAAKSIEILDAWSAVLARHTNSNAPLQAGWAGAVFARAAELIRHTGGGWQAAGVDRFATMLRTIFLPALLKGAPAYNGNWELIMTDAALGLAVFLDDRAAFDRAVALWRGRVPAYVYLAKDGALPVPPPGGGKNTPAKLIAYWQHQSTFVDGLAQETCRDLNHTGWGLAAAVHGAETARLQGVDLYAEGQARLVAAFEFHAAFDLGKPVPKWLCGGALRNDLGRVAELAYNHFHNRLGASMPETLRLIQTHGRPAGADYFMAWETLTHAENP